MLHIHNWLTAEHIAIGALLTNVFAWFASEAAEDYLYRIAASTLSFIGRAALRILGR